MSLPFMNAPAVGFNFLVTFINIPVSDGLSAAGGLGALAAGVAAVASVVPMADIDTRFTEVSGLTAEVQIEELIEAGENGFIHRLPTRTKFNNLVLKRGLPSLDISLVTQWANAAIYDNNYSPCQVLVSLLDPNGIPIRSWRFVNAYPVKIQMTDFKALDNSICIETLELCYDYFKPLSLADAISSAVSAVASAI